MATITRTLSDTGVELADGLEVSFYGKLKTVPSSGRLRLVAQTVDARVALGAAVLQRDQLQADLERSGDRGAQRALPRRPPSAGSASSAAQQQPAAPTCSAS